ncbi:UPF0149 family protein [Microbulbifer bruguierae]|uniref:UPF0149 family protein n=1 Tax=Microbulbifer bruguierae TaxID=3029061 RepID=A0ABY8NAK8_9GAMM|nr:UPF0149 family protein [Microbulbifer bruguierae]WGL15936.1 UPF0149 family protein [Microbulbifer bruguierae]
MSSAKISFDNLANQIVAAGGHIGPSELHGFICGLLATGERPDKSRWQKELAEFLDLDAVPADLARDAQNLVQDSLTELSDSDFSFQLLLSSSDDLAERGQTLCLWCAGFLHGFGIGKFSAELLPTSSEALKDIAEIAQLDASAMESDAEQERQLFEVQEYVRMAALNVFVECNAGQQAKEAAGSARKHDGDSDGAGGGENGKPDGPTVH